MRRLVVLAVMLMGLSAPAFAATEAAYTKEGFAQAQAAGKPILVDVWASWCPTCKAQAPTLASIVADPAYKDLVVLKVDFDAQKDALQAFGVRMQSTLIAFKGASEVGRSTGDTDPASIKALVAKVKS